MSTPDEKGKKIPEFFIFDRVDELEKITLELMEKTETAEPRLKDTAALAREAFSLAMWAFLLAFDTTSGFVKNPREFKDEWVSYLKKRGLGQPTVDLLHEWMVSLCKRREKNQ